MKVAIIPARGGSVRIPRKNIRQFHGKPIMAYAIDTAKRSGLFDSIWVSTEDRAIADVARAYGAGWIQRPHELAELHGAPDPGTQAVTKHALEWLKRGNIKPSLACCIYPCTPLMTEAHLQRGMEIIERGPQYAFVRGWFYWGWVSAFMGSTPLEGNSVEVAPPAEIHIDINEEADWLEAERVYRERYMEKAA
jgi:pseudaminic acid cytidylyltransferase